MFTVRALLAMRWWGLVMVMLASMVLVSGCKVECHEPSNSVPGTHECSAVQVDRDIDSATSVHDRLMTQLRPNDGIVVHFQKSGDMEVSPNIITIVAASTLLFVLAHDHWLPQEAADKMVAEAQQAFGGDRVAQVLAVIDKIHQWQDAHPRQGSPAAASGSPSAPPATMTVTVTKEPPKPAVPAPPYKFGPIILAWAIILASVALYVAATLTVARVIVLRHRRTCDRCGHTDGMSLCTKHVGRQLWGAVWWAAVPLWLIYKLSMRAGDNLMSRDMRPRQERKLLEAENRRMELDIEKRRVEAEYNKSVVTLGEFEVTHGKGVL